jgi:hypothetical protein
MAKWLGVVTDDGTEVMVTQAEPRLMWPDGAIAVGKPGYPWYLAYFVPAGGREFDVYRVSGSEVFIYRGKACNFSESVRMAEAGGMQK